MGMFLLAARFVVMLLSRLVHQIQLIHQTALFQQFQRSVYCDAIQLRVFLAGQVIEALGIQVLSGLVDQIEEDLPLASQAHSRFGGRFGDGRARWLFERHANPQCNRFRALPVQSGSVRALSKEEDD